jgi:hypothetical protein
MKRTDEIQGKRLPDQPLGSEQDKAQPGDFWKWCLEDGSTFDLDPWPVTNLTGSYWGGITPNGLRMNLLSHTVREEDDGSITVKPGDGSSNSILVSDGEESWHGYITNGLWWSLA